MSFQPRPYPSYIETRTEQVLWDAREREEYVIHAMQQRMAGPFGLFSLWHRKPWRSKSRPNLLSIVHGGPLLLLRNFWGWLIAGHDCADPAVGCSCSGSFRFPDIHYVAVFYVNKEGETLPVESLEGMKVIEL